MDTLTTTAARIATHTAGIAGLMVATGLAGCATPPLYTSTTGLSTGPLPPPSTQVLFYPAAGQTAGQQDRDRYECYRWAEQQTAFDPGSPHIAPHQRVEVIPGSPPGANVAGGAVTGALVGAAVSRPRVAGGGAIIGALAGALIGAAADAENATQAQRAQEHLDLGNARQEAQLDQDASAFRRAMSACLEARGYSVR